MTETSANSTSCALPIACNLSSAEQARREQETVKEIMAGCLETNELADGYEFRFTGNDEWFSKLTEFVGFERKCCPFFTFQLEFGPQQSAIWLRLIGAEGVKEFVGHWLNLNGEY